MIDGVLRWSVVDDCHQKSKKKPDPSRQETHVVSRGAEDGVDRIAFSSISSAPIRIRQPLPGRRMRSNRPRGDDPLLSYEQGGSCARLGLLPGPSFMPGRGGGWTVPLLVSVDRL